MYEKFNNEHSELKESIKKALKSNNNITKTELVSIKLEL
jgi:hypothetical protein